jgi:GxxExxY protein
MDPNRVTRADGSVRQVIEKSLSHAIIGGAFEVHKELGFGFSEGVYVRSLAVALQQRQLHVEREYPVAVRFRGVDVGFHRLDLLIEGRIVVEIKTMEKLPQMGKAQVRRYLLAAGKELGILINFGPSVQFCRILNASFKRNSL